jgi:hypothetical protein
MLLFEAGATGARTRSLKNYRLALAMLQERVPNSRRWSQALGYATGPALGKSLLASSRSFIARLVEPRGQPQQSDGYPSAAASRSWVSSGA